MRVVRPWAAECTEPPKGGHRQNAAAAGQQLLEKT